MEEKCNDCPYSSDKTQETATRIAEQHERVQYLERRLDEVLPTVIALTEELREIRHTLYQIEQEEGHLIHCIVARSGIPLDRKQQASTVFYLRKMAQRAIESQDPEKIKFLRECMMDDNYEQDIISPIIRDLDSAYMLYSTSKPSDTDEAGDERIQRAIEELIPFFNGHRSMTAQFVYSIDGRSDMNVTAQINNYAANWLITPGIKKVALWKILHDYGLYKAGQTNFRNQVHLH